MLTHPDPVADLSVDRFGAGPPAGDPRVEIGAWLAVEGPHTLAFPLTQAITRVGRADPNGPNHPDLALEADDAISRRHLEIRRAGATCEVVDLGSTNGTLVNDEELLPHRPRRLFPGDRILLGSV